MIAALRRRAFRRPRPPLPVRIPRPPYRAFTEWEEAELMALHADRGLASPGALFLARELADGLRKRAPDLSDADLARVVLAVSRFAWWCREEQDDAEDAWVALADGLAFGAAELAALDLETAP